MESSSKYKISTCRLQRPHGFQLLDDGGEGVGDDGDHDEDGEQQDQQRRHDQLHVWTQRKSVGEFMHLFGLLFNLNSNQTMSPICFHFHVLR